MENTVSNKVINLDDIRHGVRVANLSIKLTKILNLSESLMRKIYMAALLHDIGKAYVDTEVLNKQGKLDYNERIEIEKHVIFSDMEVFDMGYSEEISALVKYHHESYDGTGYPEGLKGKEIPIGARILKICDVFDALTNDRVYRYKYSNQEAFKIMIEEKSKYDPELLKLFINIISEKGEVNFNEKDHKRNHHNSIANVYSDGIWS